MPGKNVVYIAGIFEDETSSIFLEIKALSGRLKMGCEFIGLYPDKSFGSYSFTEEVKRINRIVIKNQPQIVIAHSLGGYIAIQIPTSCSLVLLDPSLNITDIILPNVKNGKYDDGVNTFQISQDFLDSIRTSGAIEILAKDTEKKWYSIDIFGAGKGGYKIAEQYYRNLADSNYFMLPEAGHDFSDQISKQKILEIINKRATRC